MINGIGRTQSNQFSYNRNATSMQTDKPSFQNRLIDAQSNRAINELNILGPSAPDKVKNAWMKAEEESGVNGYGMDSEGKFSQITALFAMSVENMANGKGQDILGCTVDSAKSTVQKALDRLGIPQNDLEKKEKFFYEAFLRLL